MTDQDFPVDDTALDAADATAEPTAITEAGDSNELDLAAIEADLDDVQAALARLADGSYWTDEVTGTAIPTDVLASTPLSRRA